MVTLPTAPTGLYADGEATDSSQPSVTRQLRSIIPLATPYLVVDVGVEIGQEAHEAPLPHAQKVPPLLLALVEQLLLGLLVLRQLLLDLLVLLLLVLAEGVVDLGVLLLLATQEPLLDLLVLVELLVQHGAHSAQLQQQKQLSRPTKGRVLTSSASKVDATALTSLQKASEYQACVGHMSWL